MVFVVGASLFVLGVVVDRVGRVLGTLLSLVPALVYFAYLGIIQIDGNMDDREYADLAGFMIVGLLAFLSAPDAMWLVRAGRKHRRGEPDAGEHLVQ